MNSRVVGRSIKAFYATEALEFADFTLGIYLIYFHNYVGLSFTQALSLYVAKLGMSTAFDLFGGGIADAYGRRLSYRAGMVLSIAAFTVPVIFLHNFILLFVLAAIAGVGDALAKNTLSATMADLLEDDQPLYRKVNARVQSFLFLSRAGASVIGGFLYLVYPPMPFIAEAIGYSLAIICSFGIDEPARENIDTSKAGAFGMVIESLGHLRRKTPNVFQAAVFAALTSFLAGDIFFSYYQPFFARHGYSSSELGIMLAAISLLSAAGAWRLQYFQHRGFRVTALVFTAIAMAINGIGFMTNLSAIVLVTMLLQAFTNGFAFPTMRLMVTESTPKRIRASTLSALTTITSACTMLALLTSGMVADHGTPQLVGGLGLVIITSAGLWFWRQSQTAASLSS
jgi:MFS family permease